MTADKELSEDEKKMLEEIKSTVRPEKNVEEEEKEEIVSENDEDDDIEKYEKEDTVISWTFSSDGTAISSATSFLASVTSSASLFSVLSSFLSSFSKSANGEYDAADVSETPSSFSQSF